MIMDTALLSPAQHGQADLGATRDTSVDKALALLNSFEIGDVAVGVSELARRVGIPKSTAFRLLSILEANRMVVRDGNRYALGYRLFELGQRVPDLQPHRLRDVATPYMEDLHQLSGENVHLTVLDRSDVTYISKVFGHRRSPCPTAIGRRTPAHCTAGGKALLAFSGPDRVRAVLSTGLTRRTPYTIVAPGLFVRELEQVRRRGFAFDSEEAQVGMTCIAAPILVNGRDPVAALSISGSVGRFDPRRYARQLCAVAGQVARDLEAGAY
jgi:IclR family KDG regulon transcriptional repressor